MPKIDKKCKICRRAGEKLFLKGERCFSPKCAMIKRNYPPGRQGQKGYPRLSSFGTRLKEKQKVKNQYFIGERQLQKYMRSASSKKGNTGQFLLQTLERRLDNVIFRLGLAKSRKLARQIVSHNHIQVNGKNINIPSYLVRAKDELKVNEKSKNRKYFQDIIKGLEKYEPPKWLNLDKKGLNGKVLNLPVKEDLELGVDVQLIVEYYSK